MFQNQRIVITGGSSGIGLATARLLIAQEAQVIIAGRSEAKLKEAINFLGSRASGFVVDVTNEAEVKTFFEQLEPFDHLVTAAADHLLSGTRHFDDGRLFLEERSVIARSLFKSKYWGQYFTAKYAAPKLRQTGSLVLVSGWFGRKPAIGAATIAAIDGAIEALGRTLALELAPRRVNVISPGPIDTPLWKVIPDEQARQANFKAIAANLPLKRMGQAEDIAQAIVFMLANSFTTGTVLDVDGGQR